MAKLEVDKVFSVIAEAGFTKVDLLCRMPHLSLDPDECDPQDIIKAAKTTGVEIANLGTYVGAGFESDDESVQEQALKDMKRALDLAEMFGAKSIRAKAGDDDPAKIDRMVPWFQRGSEYAEAKGIPMGIENHGGGINGNPEVCVELFEKVGSEYFGVLYEPANLEHAGVDSRYALGVMRDHVNHMHYKPWKGFADEYALTMLDEGIAALKWNLAYLDRIGYQGDIALEYEYKGESAETGLAKWAHAVLAI
jgi:sugar phosphate isomerase/epimerase